MAMRVEDSKLSEAVELIAEKGFQGMREAMLMERHRYLGAAPYERSEKRLDHANGFKPKQLKTTVGSLSLQVPQVSASLFL